MLFANLFLKDRSRLYRDIAAFRSSSQKLEPILSSVDSAPMSNLRQLQNLVKSSFAAGAPANGRRSLSLFLRDTPRRFSTEAEQPQDATVDKILETPTTGAFYGKLFGITRNTLKSDIVNFLEGCNLKLDDIRIMYNRSYMPLGMVIQFASQNAFNQAFRTVARKGRLYKIEKTDHIQWDSNVSYDGKTILLQGIPRTAQFDDVERFLSGYEYDASSIQLFYRQAIPVKLATVSFPTQTQAMSAFLTKNKGFCLNEQIMMRVLQ